jgi:hypothetical protein
MSFLTKMSGGLSFSSWSDADGGTHTASSAKYKFTVPLAGGQCPQISPKTARPGQLGMRLAMRFKHRK